MLNTKFKTRVHYCHEKFPLNSQQQEREREEEKGWVGVEGGGLVMLFKKKLKELLTYKQLNFHIEKQILETNLPCDLYKF